MLNDKVVLITGGTGSFGKKFTEIVLQKYNVKKLIVLSRDEFKQHEMNKIFSEKQYPIRFFLGDVRDKARLCRAFEGVDYVIHAAALKQVPALEYNPIEAVKTNIMGADNIVDAAIDCGVKKVIALSTDKAVNPVNLYGATKLAAEKIFIAANAYGGGKVKFSVVRYGNVMGSRGSVIPFFQQLKQEGVKEFPITDERMTRFWITLEQSVELVLKAIEHGQGGEVFVPIIPSMKIVDLAKVINPNCKFKTIGIRPGEKLHEVLISEDESRSVKKIENIYAIMPAFYRSLELEKKYAHIDSMPERFSYRSDTNDKWISPQEMTQLIEEHV